MSAIIPIYTYKEYCKWIANEISKPSVYIPGYGGVDKPLGCDSSGGSDVSAYATMCKKGYLTITSQEGYCDERETQFSFVDFLIPLAKSSYFISKVSKLVEDGIIDIYHLDTFDILHKNTSGEFYWKPHSKRITLTIVDGKDVTGLWPDEYSIGNDTIKCISEYYNNNYKFSHKLCKKLRKNKLQTFACVMRKSGEPIMQYILPLFC